MQSSTLIISVLISVLLAHEKRISLAGTVLQESRTVTGNLQSVLRASPGQCVDENDFTCKCMQDDVFDTTAEMGGGLGSSFDDRDYLRFNEVVKTVTLGDQFGSVSTVTFTTNRREYRHRVSFSSFQSVRSLSLYDSETIIRMDVCTLEVGATTEVAAVTLVNHVTLYTSFGRNIEAGTRAEACFTFHFDLKDIVGVRGATGVFQMSRIAPILRLRLC